MIEEEYAKAIEMLNLLPSFHFGSLFPDKIENILKFTINYQLNVSNRVVFSFRDRLVGKHGKDWDIFQSYHCRIYGYSASKDEHKFSLNKAKYPKEGEHFIDDLSPVTIFKIVLLIIENNSECDDDLISNYIMSISDKANEWKVHFSRLADDIDSYIETIDDIYDKTL